MADIVNKVLTVYKADTSDAKAQVRGLRGEEARAARERLDELSKQNQGIQGQIEFWGKATLAIGAVAGAYVVAQKAAKAALEDMRLESAAAGAKIDDLRKATRGLVEEDDLLAFAGKTMHGVWKLNQKEMETVLQGAMALRKTMGVELQPTIEALTEAITKGSTRALKEFGIEAKDKGDVIRILDEQFKSLHGNVGLAGDEFESANTQMADSLDNLVGAFGRLVIALGPAIDLLAKALGGTANFIANFVTYWGDESRDNKSDKQNLATWDQSIKNKQRLLARAKEGGSRWQGGGAGMDPATLEAEIAQLMHERAMIQQKIKAAETKQLNTLLAGAQANVAESIRIMNASRPKKSGGRSRGGSVAAAGAAGLPFDAFTYGGDDAFDAFRASESAELTALREYNAAVEDLRNAAPPRAGKVAQGPKPPGLLEQIFGSSEEINELAMSIDLVTGSMEVMQNTATAAMEAYITGSKSIGSAIRDALADGIKAMALDMTAKAVWHGLEALGSFLMGNPADAAKHGVLAAKYSAGAVALGVMAKSMHQSAPPVNEDVGAGAGAGSGAGGYIGGGSAQPTSRNITVILDDAWYGRSRTERAADMARAINQAKRGTQHIRRN